ncbi:S-crystallin 4-like isoform X2 [Acanthaster planci]|uniref:S-crystallin 4-like isoform X2 n=1 Tax=Acanthaster planci TaxID=133434 RepID=A0A8B7XL13_ACAPL|nr:S-crystallin 4-like isoform X2 [Acanthaster planci]
MHLFSTCTYPRSRKVVSPNIAVDQPDAPMQQLPYLEVDGKKIPQSRAMHGFVAREFGLNGANNEETTKIDVIIASLEDIRLPLSRIVFREQDEEKKKELLAKFYAETAPKFFTALEKMLVENGGDGFLVGSKISRADIFFYVVMEFLDQNEVKKYPKLVALMERVAKDPKIAAYLAKRPQTEW